MRIWHKDLICVLPKQQLLSQYRECCAIMRSIKLEGTPNHILVNKIMNYPIEHFYTYTFNVILEMRRRGYQVNPDRFTQWIDEDIINFEMGSIFEGWHNERYLVQCYANLQEKYDCGGIAFDEWAVFHEKCYKLLEKSGWIK